MAETAVSLALGTIRDLLLDEARFLSGVGKKVREVEAKLRKMQCFLKDMDKRKYEEESIRDYVKDIRDLAYRIEDVVETYAVNVTSRRGRTARDILKRFACILCVCISMHNIGSEVEQIETDITNLASNLQSFDLVRSDEYSDARNQRQKWLRQTFGHEIEEDFVGKKADIDELVKRIMLEEGDRDYRVISIHGMGGLGKTTLAQNIYNHPVVRRGFQAFAWTCVTQECNPRSLMQDVLKQLVEKPEEEEKIKQIERITKMGECNPRSLMQDVPKQLDEKQEEEEQIKQIERIMKMGYTELVEELCNVQKKKKCLVVLDDIWKVDDWKILSPAFESREANSKVLLTTRNEGVAKEGSRYSLGFLSKEEGWELLQKKAFSRRDSRDLSIEPKLVENIGMEIVHKCGYLPLAISVLGGILSDKDSLDEWETVKKNIDVYLDKGNGNEEEKIKQVLSLSYDELPYHLKPCFLYFGHFKEDETIDVEQLYLLWMAEGMVLPEHQGKEESLMDVAKRYLFELANRSMVQLKGEEFHAREQTKSCCLHDLMRDLCLDKSVEEEFVSVMDFQGGKRPDLRSSSNTSRALRRLSIYIDSDDFCFHQIRKFSSQLRSVQLQVCPKYRSTSFKRGIDLKNLKLLRILKLTSCDFVGNEIPKEICKLVHLRFLGVRKCYLVKLPSSIADLLFLQTLDLQSKSSYGISKIEIPNALWNMKRLRYLYLPENTRPKGRMLLGGLDELETLVGFVFFLCNEIEELYKLTNLRRLEATVGDNQELSEMINYMAVNGNRLRMVSLRVYVSDFSSKEGFALLKKLFISPNLLRLEIVGPICKLPHHEPDFCRSLVELTLKNSSIDEGDPMEVLEKLPKLRILFMKLAPFMGKEMTCRAMGFPKLRQLSFDFLPNLEKWTVEKGAMPYLSHLQIRSCHKLEMIPDGLKFVTSLQKLHIVWMPEEFENRVQEGGEDFDKICHVHFVSIES